MTPRWRVGPLSTAMALALTLALARPVAAQELPPPPADGVAQSAPSATRSGREIYARFREGLADKQCETGTSQRWREHFANAPRRMAAKNDDVLPLFGYVVDTLRASHLPTEYRPDPVRRERLQARRAQRQRSGRPVADDLGHRAQPRHRHRAPVMTGACRQSTPRKLRCAISRRCTACSPATGGWR